MPRHVACYHQTLRCHSSETRDIDTKRSDKFQPQRPVQHCMVTKLTDTQWKPSQSGQGKARQKATSRWGPNEMQKDRERAAIVSATWRLPVGSDVDKRRCQRHTDCLNNSSIRHPSPVVPLCRPYTLLYDGSH